MRNLWTKFLGLNWLGVGQTLVKNWQTVLVISFALLFMKAVHDRDQAKIAQGKAEQAANDKALLVAKYQQEAKDANDSLGVLGNRLDEMHADYEQQFAFLGRRLGRVDTLALERWVHDTVAWADTIRVPVNAVTSADSMLHVCSDYISTCQQFRVYAAKRFAADSQTILTLKNPDIQVPSRRCGIQFTLGPSAIYGTDKQAHLGVGGTLGLGCRW